MTSTTSTATTPTLNDPFLVWRGMSFVVLVILFQVVVANNTTLSHSAKRRWQHALTGHALVQISYFLPYHLCLVALFLGAVGMLAFQQLVPHQFYQTFGPLLRPDELEGRKLPGAFYFLLGTALSALGTGSDQLYVARYAVECLALADPMASFVGATIRSPSICSGSSISGCMACFVTAWCVGYLMLTTPSDEEVNPTFLYRVTVGALTCTMAEAIPYGNDNMNIPISVTLVILLLSKT